jgi:hypothetical protein
VPTFEPIELLPAGITREENDQDHPYTVPLNAQPSAEWQAYFEGMNWEQVLSVSRAQFPKIVDGGIAIPDVKFYERDKLFVNLDVAIASANEAEAERMKSAPPTMEESYAAWQGKRGPSS